MHTSNQFVSKKINLLFAIVLSHLLLIPSLAISETEAGFCLTCGATGGSSIEASKLKGLADVSAKLSDQFNSSNFLSPELVENLDSRVLGKMIVDRLHAVCDKDRDPTSTKPTDVNSQIIMLVPLKNLESISKFGFKNQHQTGSTGGCNCKANRLVAEVNHVAIGLPYSNKTRELLPKYALQVFYTDKMGTNPAPLQYGNVMVRFKSEVNERATWSAQDSLGLKETLRTNQIRPKKDTRCISYCEAQIWGALDFSDAESIVLPEGTEVTEDIKKIGLPVYTYTANFSYGQSSGSTVQATIGKKPIFEPSGKSIPLPVNMSVEDLAKEIAAETNTAKKGILEAARIGKLSTEELISEFKSPETSLESKSTAYSYMGPELGTKSNRILAEIAARPQTSETKAVLLEQIKSGSNDAKALAFTGLTSVDWKELKPLILQGLKSTETVSYYEKNLLKTTLRMISLNHLDDEDIVKALGSEDSSLVEKYKNKNICQKEVYE